MSYKLYRIIILFKSLTVFFIPTLVNAQTVYVGYGSATLLTQQSIRLIKSRNDFSYSAPQYIVGIKFDYKKSKVVCQFVNYDARTMIKLSKNNGIGFSGSNVSRVDIGIEYSIFNSRIINNVSPLFLLGIQSSKRKYDIWADQLSINGPDYFQTTQLSSRSLNLIQLVPSIGLDIGIKVIKGCCISLRFQGVYGIKSFQNIYLSYKHKESINTERQAVFDTKGTGLFSSLNLNYSFKKKSK